MPRIHDLFADCVVYIYSSIADARSGARTGGSGFLTFVPFAVNTNWGEAYIVTNRHVIQAANAPIVRVNRKDGAVEFLSTSQDQWHFHPDGDDVAAHVLEAAVPRDLKTYVVNVKDFLTVQTMTKDDVGIGDDAFMVGRFINHEGRQQNTPAVRFGNIAMMPKEKIASPEGLAHESFLVETRSLPGYSGAPVFLYSVNAMMDFSRRDLHEEEEKLRAKDRKRFGKEALLIDPGPLAHMKPKGPYLLGIDWCHLNTIERVRERNGELIPDGWTVRTNSGMAGVAPAWKIAELLNCQELVKKRDIEDERLTKQEGER